MTETESLFVRACRGLATERPPIWMMRQAGRYMPQYRKIREKVSFLELCRSPDIACEVTMQPIDEFGFDAAILFSDIMITLPPMGIEVEFTPGPVLPRPVRNDSDIKSLKLFDPVSDLPYVSEAVAKIKRALPTGTPLIGFAGSPFTLLTYCVEGGGSKSYPKTRQMLYEAPQSAHALLEKLALTTASHLSAQISAGADVVQLFDSWAGILPPEGFREFACRWAKVVIESLRTDHPSVPIIYFANGCAPYLDQYQESGADVLGIDWRVDLSFVRATLGPDQPVQGNMDPGCLYLPQDKLVKKVKSIIEAGASSPGHIFNLGHGVLPTAPMEGVRTMVDTVKSWSRD